MAERLGAQALKLEQSLFRQLAKLWVKALLVMAPSRQPVRTLFPRQELLFRDSPRYPSGLRLSWNLFSSCRRSWLSDPCRSGAFREGSERHPVTPVDSALGLGREALIQQWCPWRIIFWSEAFSWDAARIQSYCSRSPIQRMRFFTFALLELLWNWHGSG